MVENSVSSVKGAASALNRLRNPNFKVGRSEMYVLEFFLLLVHVVVGVHLVKAMFNSVLDSWTDQSQSMLPFVDKYTELAAMIAATFVVIPLMLLLFTRVQSAENADKSMRKKTWRAIWQNVFLAGIFAWLLSSLIGLANELVEALMNIGLTDGGEELWASLLRYGFIGALLGWIMFHFYGENLNNEKERPFLVVFAGVATLMLLLTAVYPLAEQRNSQIDEVISQDLSDISTKVDAYVSSENDLPVNLSDLELSDEIMDRSSSHNYRYSRSSSSSFGANYELCANFRTDTTEVKANPVPELNVFDAISGRGNSLTTIPTNNSQFDIHEKGSHCFDVSASRFNPFTSSFEDTTDQSEPVEIDSGSFEGSEGDIDIDTILESIQ